MLGPDPDIVNNQGMGDVEYGKVYDIYFPPSYLVTNLDLLNNHLGEEAGLALAEALKSNSSLASLNLNSNQLGEKAGLAVAEALKSNSTLTNLDLFNN